MGNGEGNRNTLIWESLLGGRWLQLGLAQKVSHSFSVLRMRSKTPVLKSRILAKRSRNGATKIGAFSVFGTAAVRL